MPSRSINKLTWAEMQQNPGVAMVSYPENLNSSGQPANSAPPDQAVFEADKRAVYKHPLFPLLALLFERCEQATQSAETPNSESFNMDIQAFVQHQERDCKPFLINDSEVDGLMIKAIQVLRIHLLELEKVQELCKDFCNRYITCLKGKMQSENLLRSDYSTGFVENNNNSHSSNSNSPTVFSPHSLQVVSPTGSFGGCEGGFVKSGPMLDPSPHYPTATSPPSPNHSPQHIIHGSTPLSQIGANCLPPASDLSLHQGSLSATSGGSGDEDDDLFGSRKKQKRGVLPKQATSIMRSWLFQHLVNPYPKEDEKREIAAQTNLTLLQVNNWFINARRRILQPMLDASTPSDVTGSTGGSTGTKSSSSKTKSGNNGSQCFWPANIPKVNSADITEDSSLLSGDESESSGSGDDTSDIGKPHSEEELSEQ
ncbi:homeobox protein PKNOX2-like isoform X2 [Macrosteles quadrilineatus]|uniref:homeobox protein PKNOX2-like isoform X2 n=1 Tax=Macrosteles quadrilineatus TaxID=74068 RepID=UPI0023E25932|nr:homeobox protein PKNOX2-like isoform X2 [Macrosteles quadrilineatus]